MPKHYSKADAQEVLDSLPYRYAAFVESEHPRDEEGKFTEKESDQLWNKTLAEAIPEDKMDDQDAFDAHKSAVEKALQEGKPVPKKVIADYPDLVAKQVKSKSERSEDVVKELSTKLEISSEDVGRLLASQHHNVEARARGSERHDADSLVDKWVSSSSFVKMEIPIDLAKSATEVIKGDASVSQGMPIVVDDNKTGTGRHLGNFGAPAEFLILDGKHRQAEAKASGKKFIVAFVGNRALEKVKAAGGKLVK